MTDTRERCNAVCPIRKFDTGPYHCELEVGHLGPHQAQELEKYAKDFYPVRSWEHKAEDA